MVELNNPGFYQIINNQIKLGNVCSECVFVEQPHRQHARGLSLSLAARERPFNCQCYVREKASFLRRHRGGGACHCQNRMQVTSYRGRASNQIYTPSASVLFGPNRQCGLLNMSGKVWLGWKITDTVIMLNPDSTLLHIEVLVLCLYTRLFWFLSHLKPTSSFLSASHLQAGGAFLFSCGVIRHVTSQLLAILPTTLKHTL